MNLWDWFETLARAMDTIFSIGASDRWTGFNGASRTMTLKLMGRTAAQHCLKRRDWIPRLGRR